MIIKVSRNSKLPLKICKGSVKSRLELARHYNNEFFNNICNKFENNLIDKDLFSQNLSSINNNKIKFNLKDSNAFENYLGHVDAVFDKKNSNKIVSYDIYIPISQNNKICLDDADIFMHETFHYFYSITNPKHLSRIIEMSKNKLAAKTEKFYGVNLCARTGDYTGYINTILHNYMTFFSKDKQIKILQSWRYRLNGELEAYKEGAKYHKIFQDKYKKPLSEHFYCENGESFYFEEKIKIIEKKLAKTLAEARKDIVMFDKHNN